MTYIVMMHFFIILTQVCPLLHVYARKCLIISNSFFQNLTVYYIFIKGIHILNISKLHYLFIKY